MKLMCLLKGHEWPEGFEAGKPGFNRNPMLECQRCGEEFRVINSDTGGETD